MIWGGGTKMNAEATSKPVVVVDLQALGLDEIHRLGDETLHIGAMVTLQQIVDHPEVPIAIRESAQREHPSTLRAQATLGGSVMTADPESELLAALLVHDAVVRVTGRGGSEELKLHALLGDPDRPANRIVTGVTIETTGVTAIARTARTRSDKAIVVAVARLAHGRRRLALSGVASTPVLVEDVTDLDPPGDFRGSSAYRRTLAVVLAARAMEATS